MQICFNCKKEMTCIKSGMKVIYSGGYHVYFGDLFGCSCGNKTVVTSGTPVNPVNPVNPVTPAEFDIVMS